MRQHDGGNNLLRQFALACLAVSMAAPALGQTYVKIVSKQSGKVMDVQGVSTNNGAWIQQWDWWAGDNQQWQLVTTNAPYFKLVSKLSGKVADVAGGSSANGAQIQQWDWNLADWQQWQQVAVDSPNYKIVSKASGKVMDVTYPSTNNGDLVHQWDWLGGANQEWQLVQYSPAAPAYISLTPGSGNTAEQVFTLVWYSPNGWQDIGQADVLVTADKSLPGPACTMVYQVSSNQLSMSTDAGPWIGGQLATGGVLSNTNECSVNLGNSHAQGSGNYLTMTLDLTFLAQFAGTTQRIYMGGSEAFTGMGNDWQWMGTWTVPSAPPGFSSTVTEYIRLGGRVVAIEHR